MCGGMMCIRPRLCVRGEYAADDDERKGNVLMSV